MEDRDRRREDLLILPPELYYQYLKFMASVASASIVSGPSQPSASAPVPTTQTTFSSYPNTQQLPIAPLGIFRRSLTEVDWDQFRNQSLHANYEIKHICNSSQLGLGKVRLLFQNSATAGSSNASWAPQCTTCGHVPAALSLSDSIDPQSQPSLYISYVIDAPNPQINRAPGSSPHPGTSNRRSPKLFDWVGLGTGLAAGAVDIYHHPANCLTSPSGQMFANSNAHDWWFTCKGCGCQTQKFSLSMSMAQAAVQDPRLLDPNYFEVEDLANPVPAVTTTVAIPTDPSIRSPSIPVAIDKCECGSYKVMNVGKGQPGHSSWCPWK